MTPIPEDGGGMGHTEIITVINQLGLPIGLVIILLFFGAKFVWPFFTDQIKTLQAEREASKELMLKMQTMFINSLDKIHDQIIKRLEELATTIDRSNEKDSVILDRLEQLADRLEKLADKIGK